LLVYEKNRLIQGVDLEHLLDEIAENAAMVHSLLESIEDNCFSESITFDDLRALSQYGLAYNQNIFLLLG
jgi:hypothetical protein